MNPIKGELKIPTFDFNSKKNLENLLRLDNSDKVQ